MSTFELDTARNRAARKYTRGEQWRRLFWSFGRWLLILSPRPMFAWRRCELRVFGATVGAHVNVYPSTRIYMPWNVTLGDWVALGEDVFIYSLAKVRIARGATVSYRAHICAGTHDFSDPTLPLMKVPVTIEDNAWIGTDAFIGPGVTIGTGAIVGARAVVVRPVEPLHVVAGNPAKTISHRRMRV